MLLCHLGVSLTSKSYNKEFPPHHVCISSECSASGYWRSKFKFLLLFSKPTNTATWIPQLDRRFVNVLDEIRKWWCTFSKVLQSRMRNYSPEHNYVNQGFCIKVKHHWNLSKASQNGSWLSWQLSFFVSDKQIKRKKRGSRALELHIIIWVNRGIEC